MMTIADVYANYRVKRFQYKYVIAIGENIDGLTNDALGKLTKVSPQEAGQQAKILEQLGIIKDINPHPIRKTWVISNVNAYTNIKETGK